MSSFKDFLDADENEKSKVTVDITYDKQKSNITGIEVKNTNDTPFDPIAKTDYSSTRLPGSPLVTTQFGNPLNTKVQQMDGGKAKSRRRRKSSKKGGKSRRKAGSRRRKGKK